MIEKPKVLTFRVTELEYEGLMSLCEKHRLTRQEMLRALVIDALVDEGVECVRRFESQGCPSSRETSEASGAATA